MRVTRTKFGPTAVFNAYLTAMLVTRTKFGPAARVNAYLAAMLMTRTKFGSSGEFKDQDCHVSTWSTV